MHIKDKIRLDRAGLEKYGPINIVAFGDSVTHGAVGNGENDYETVYWNRLKKKILAVSDYIPVNVIDAGIGGTCAMESVSRIDRQVLKHEPDLVIVCFGLNDVNRELEEFLTAIRTIFERLLASGTDVIFMTPNMLNTSVAEDTAPYLVEYAKKTANIQNGGRMDEFMSSAVRLATDMGVTVCDCYSEWKKLAGTQDITDLLANRINHPTREMHELFASMLFDVVFDGCDSILANHTGTMYKG